MRRSSLLAPLALVVLVSPARAQDPKPPTALSASGFKKGIEPTKGAWFYKVSSAARADATGIEGTGVLPHVFIDPARQHTPAGEEDEYLRGPMDVPSVYMGGNAGTELDCGLSWSRVLDDAKRPLWTDDPSGSDMRRAAHRFRIDVVKGALAATDGDGRRLAVRATGTTKPVGSLDALARTPVDLVASDGAVVAKGVTLRPDFAFRPFWRTMTNKKGGGYANEWANPQPGDPGYVWLYPGERFSMKVRVTAPEKVALEIASRDDPSVKLQTTFEQARFGTGHATTWKRVNSIDQFREVATGERKGNEGRPLIRTHSKVEGARWDAVALDAKNGGRVAMIGPAFREEHGAELGASAYASVFKRSGFTSAGGESLDIVPLAPAKTPGVTGKLGQP